MLDVGTPITFVATYIIQLASGDLKLHQERFTETLLVKRGMGHGIAIESFRDTTRLSRCFDSYRGSAVSLVSTAKR